MSQQDYDPSVDNTIFPRINFLKQFNQRGLRRDYNGRIFLEFGFGDINNPERYPPEPGAECSDFLLPFPKDLLDGDSITDTPSNVVDLRKSCDSVITLDLGPL